MPCWASESAVEQNLKVTASHSRKMGCVKALPAVDAHPFSVSTESDMHWGEGI